MSISNTDDIIDSRDIIERIEELESEHNSLIEERDEVHEHVKNGDESYTQSDLDDANDALAEFWEDEDAGGNELNNLKSLAEKGENYAPDWSYGEALIHESYFTEYSKQLCEDIGSIPSDVPAYIADNIDWDGVAEDLKVDYTEVGFDGETYYIR